jgi:hypothetical protein
MPFPGLNLNPTENVYVIRSADDIPDEFDEYVFYHFLYDYGDGLGFYYYDTVADALVPLLTVPFQDTYFEDLRFPATAINPPGAASDPDVEAASGLLLFAAGTTELVYALAQMPHSWSEGSGVFPHVHWQKTTSATGNVLWRLRYKMVPINEVMDAAWSANDDVTSPVAGTPDTDTADKHLISSFTEIDMTGKSLSDCILFEISRIGADAADTYGADARLLEFDVHIEIDAPGSDLEFTK